MGLQPTFELGLGNAWWLCLPLFAEMLYFIALRRDIAKRMADMSGYDQKEKLLTIIASIAPYPFMVATAWTPFTSVLTLLGIGMVIYLFGIVLLFLSLKVIVQTPPDQPFLSGPYRVSRNPLYVAVTAVFLGICLVTANLLLLFYLAFSIVFQHFMILAEERICNQRYPSFYGRYIQEVSRYWPGL